MITAFFFGSAAVNNIKRTYREALADPAPLTFSDVRVTVFDMFVCIEDYTGSNYMIQWFCDTDHPYIVGPNTFGALPANWIVS